MNAFLRYTVLRIMVFLGCLILLWLLGLRASGQLPLLVLGAALLSALVSFVGLRRFREDYSAQVASTIERRTAARRARGDERGADELAEDEEYDTRRGTAAPGGAAGATDPADDDFR
ncbi:DUF4229 domain-containing protein [Phycicoccus flavus]|uniref:DUF4229 domain-containing protein n=1 Tax=Phycicoccus flavus TaxID=2502783 RepID=UPI000FEBE2F1|nr:DUF4229 domain-containing protein [Phycicoccus flavus]NHA69734.1 DUF4229 domain-containing protein [Phycicoccus flavus]